MARFFADQAQLCGTADRESFEKYLQAAIVFGRSVTLHIQREYRHRPKFDSWYSPYETMMKSDPISKFFLDTRNFILKEGPVPVHKVISLSGLIDAISVTGVAEVRVIRGKPWYKRGIRILWQDFLAAAKRPMRKWRRHYGIVLRRAQAKAQTKQKRSQVSEDFYFDDPRWKDRPALELLHEYLEKLEAIVGDAEAQFGGTS